MFDRYESGEQAILVHINFTYEGELEDLDECKMLVSSAGINTLAVVTGTRQSPLPKYYVGEGISILADTVGFIRHLPHDLVAAFKATLQETQEANILLHVVDASDERFRENIEAVDIVLEEIDAHEVPYLLVMNKIDNLED